MTPVPLDVVGITPLNIEETPAPLPECKRMNTTRPIETIVCITRMMPTITFTVLLLYAVTQTAVRLLSEQSVYQERPTSPLRRRFDADKHRKRGCEIGKYAVF